MKMAFQRKTRWKSFALAHQLGRQSRLATRRRAASRLERARVLLIAALVACAALPYLNILFNGFVYDDDLQVLKNPYIRSFRHLKEIFTTNVWSFAGVVTSNYYRPMMTLGYLVCYKVFGMRAYGFHLASLLLHVLIVCLVFALTERLTGDRVWGFVAGALFALHPVHTEAVDWIAAVTDLELTFFYLLTFGLFLAVSRPGGGRSEPTLAAMGVTFFLALFSKEQAVTLPALATVYEHFYRADRLETSTSQKLARYGLLWLAGVAYVLFRLHFLGALAPEEKFRQVTRLQVVLSAIALVGQYVWKLIWPVRLCAFYVFHPSTSPFDLRVLAGLLALLALAALFLVCWRRREPNVRFASFAIVWFFATLAPVLNAHWVGFNVFTERYLYLPSVGVAWLVGLGASRLWSRAGPRSVQRWALVLAGVTVGGLFAARIVICNRDWRNDKVLYTRILDLSPNAYQFLERLADIYWREGDVDYAERLWKRALAVNPNNARTLNNLGLVAGRKKQYRLAAAFLQRAIGLNPKESDPHRNLGTTYRLMGMAGPAESELRKALTLAPLDYRVFNELGLLFLEEGHESEAEDQFRASLRNEPNVLAYDFLGEINLDRRALGEAEGNFRAALRLDESDSRAHFGLGHIYKTAGRNAEALNEYQAGLVKDPTNARALAAVQKLRQQIAGAAP
jgi:Tfp pilus assembly protein PilF